MGESHVYGIAQLVADMKLKNRKQSSCNTGAGSFFRNFKQEKNGKRFLFVRKTDVREIFYES